MLSHKNKSTGPQAHLPEVVATQWPVCAADLKVYLASGFLQTRDVMIQDGTMHILVENSGYDLVNMGDVAMLQVAVSRLHALWPTASIQVVTRSPDRLARFCPHATPLTLHASPVWYKQSIRTRLYAMLPSATWNVIAQADRMIRKYLPPLAHQVDLWNAALHGDKNHFLHADLVVATGGGYLTDSFEIFALLVLDTLETAARLGKPIALFGQGLGPLRKPAPYALARHVLPQASLIALRERRFSKPLLDELGVAAERIAVTGDDAISLAYDARQARLGQGIGVNIRVAPYSEVNPSMVTIVRDALHVAAHTYNAPLLPIPIAGGETENSKFGQSDLQSIQSLLGESEGLPTEHQFDRPAQVIAQISECRIIVTGSYHAAVFALAQGIPSVCLAKSTYYINKFLGLADQFGAGCEVLFLNDAEIGTKLACAIAHAWNSAESVRPQLLAAAQRQAAAGQRAYERLFHLVSAQMECQAKHKRDLSHL